LPIGGGLVTYDYQVYNPGSSYLTDVTLIDDKCSPVIFKGGDTNNDAKLDRGEIWKYSCQMNIDQATINTAIATGKFGIRVLTASATASVSIGSSPANNVQINIIKKAIPSVLPYDGGLVNYTYTITNPTIVSMTDVIVTDNSCSPVNYIEGDINKDNKLDPTETWTYLCRINITADTTNEAAVSANYGDRQVSAHAVASVSVEMPPVIPKKFPKTGNGDTSAKPGWVWFLSASAATFVGIKITLNIWRKFKYSV